MIILQSLLAIVQGIVSVALIAIILLQHGRGADAGASFGSGSSATVFGSRGAGNFFTRLTAILATVFLANSLALSYIAKQGFTQGSLIDQQIPAEITEADADEGITASIPILPEEAPAETAETESLPSLAGPDATDAGNVGEDSGEGLSANTEDIEAPDEPETAPPATEEPQDLPVPDRPPS
ncbi:MAG: preprotein translocase subunit SecG [Gammaproteobacteria bacterium]|nr:preprotein translocase subunit SecG [Gammaproteobacteria bacterium]